MVQGSCLCGRVRFEFDHSEGDIVYCHCRSCKKASGSAFGANVAVPRAGFRVRSGRADLSVYESSPGKVRHFCRHCGSPLFNDVVGADHLRVRLGALDSRFDQTPTAHIFMDDATPWDRPCDGIDRYERWPDPARVTVAGARRPD